MPGCTENLSYRQISHRTEGRFLSLMLLLQVVAALLMLPLNHALCMEWHPTAPVRVAVYDVPPYGAVGVNGALSGVSVDLWRRVAEELGWEYKFTAVSQMETILSGLEQGRFDAAIGAITITPEREARVDFSYPAHRSGVAVALRKETGPLAAISSYLTVAMDLGYLILGILTLLFLLGAVIYVVERPGRSGTEAQDGSVTTFREGLYWAVVTMTTVGYGDKTPKTPLGQLVAVVWMLTSLALVSLLSASLVSRLTAERVENSTIRAERDLSARKLAAVAQSSGAEYLDGLQLKYQKYENWQRLFRPWPMADRTPLSTAWAPCSIWSLRASRKTSTSSEPFSRRPSWLSRCRRRLRSNGPSTAPSLKSLLAPSGNRSRALFRPIIPWQRVRMPTEHRMRSKRASVQNSAELDNSGIARVPRWKIPVGNLAQEMMDAIQPSPSLIVRVDDPPRRLRTMRALEHDLLGFGVAIPAPEGFDIHGAQLPFLERALKALRQAAALFGERYGEPILDKKDAGARNHGLEIRHGLEKLLIFDVRTEAHNPLNACPVVPAAVEENDLAACGEMRDISLKIPLPPFPLGGRAQGDDTILPRVHSMGDALYHAAFSCGIAPLENHNDLELFGVDPLLQFHKFALKRKKRPDIDRFPNGLMRGGIRNFPYQLCKSRGVDRSPARQAR